MFECLPRTCLRRRCLTALRSPAVLKGRRRKAAPFSPLWGSGAANFHTEPFSGNTERQHRDTRPSGRVWGAVTSRGHTRRRVSLSVRRLCVRSSSEAARSLQPEKRRCWPDSGLDAPGLLLPSGPPWGRPKSSTTSTTRRHLTWSNSPSRPRGSPWPTSNRSSISRITNFSSNRWTMISGTTPYCFVLKGIFDVFMCFSLHMKVWRPQTSVFRASNSVHLGNGGLYRQDGKEQKCWPCCFLQLPPPLLGKDMPEGTWGLHSEQLGQVFDGHFKSFSGKDHNKTNLGAFLLSEIREKGRQRTRNKLGRAFYGLLNETPLSAMGDKRRKKQRPKFGGERRAWHLLRGGRIEQAGEQRLDADSAWGEEAVVIIQIRRFNVIRSNHMVPQHIDAPSDRSHVHSHVSLCGSQ
ncbi:hypothetical protein MHYP_G00120360 [Metynnis hypsauchen]